MRLSSAAAAQGSLVLVELDARQPLPAPDVRWQGRSVALWSEQEGRRYRGLLPIDLEQAPGAAPLRVRPAGRAECWLGMEVLAGDFPVERLKVAPRFVELSAENQRRAQREARALAAVFAQVTPERLWSGPFQAPLPGARASSSFGRRRILNGQPRSPHSGVDFGARSGTPVRAPQGGRVAFVESLFFAGRSVVLDHGLGLYSFFGHLSATDVRPGQVVAAGDVVGRVGATGRVTAAHLHWSLRLGEARVNPLDLLALLGR